MSVVGRTGESLDRVVGRLVRGQDSGNLMTTILNRFDDVSVRNIVGTLRYMRSGGLGRNQTLELRDLCWVEVKRQLHSITPNQVTDILCFHASMGLREDVSVLFPRLVSNLPELTGRQMGLVCWSLSRLNPSFLTGSLLTLIFSNPERVLACSPRDRAVMLDAISRSIRHCDSPAQFLTDVVTFLPNLEVKKFDSFHSAAIFFHSLARISDYGRKLGVNTSLADGMASDLIPPISDMLRRSAKPESSVQSLLTIAWSFALLKVKSQPVVVDLYRRLYSRIPDLNSNQRSFTLFLLCTASGVKDPSVAEALIRSINVPELSNNNLVNTLIVMKADGENILDEVYKRREVLRPDQLVTAMSLAGTCDGRIESEGYKALMNTCVESMSNFSVSVLVKALTIPDVELCYKVQRELLKRMKDDFSQHDMLLMASEIRRLGPHRVLTNLRVKFNRLLTLAIKNRRIDTPHVLKNLTLIDDLGTWHCLPIDVQLRLWNKATEMQKINVRPPLDPLRNDSKETRRRRIQTNQILVDVTKRESENGTKIASKENKFSPEEIEPGEVSPAREFIDIVRRYS
jgi:hypothetical protein